MIAVSIVGSIPSKRVVIDEIGDATTDEIVTFAIAAARETRSSLFGWSLNRYPDGRQASVTLHTD